MHHEARLSYRSELLREAAVAHWRRYFGVGFIAAVGLSAVSLAVLLALGDRSWSVGFIGAGLFAGLVFCGLAFWMPYRDAIAKLKAMAEPRASFVADEATFTLASSLGSSTLPWSAIVELRPSRSAWLMYFSKSQFATIPLADVPPAMQAFVRARIEAVGGSVIE